MAYTPTTWTTGDTLTATAMNKIENGIAGAGSALITQMATGNTLDKTVRELNDALLAGTPVYLIYSYGIVDGSSSSWFSAETHLCPLITIYRYADDVFRLVFAKPTFQGTIGSKTSLWRGGYWNFSASSITDYPVSYYVVSSANGQ